MVKDLMPKVRTPRTPGAQPPVLTLVIPAFNEGARLEGGRKRLGKAILSGAVDPDSTEFIVVNDGSNDDTTKKAHLLFGDLPYFQLIELPSNVGKGAAIRAGMSIARTPLVAFADADMAIDPEHIPQFVKALEDCEVAIGSRRLDGSRAEADTKRRRLERRTFNLLVRALVGVHYQDTQCGFKAFQTPVARLLFHLASTDGFAFDVELLNISDKLGLRVSEVPVAWKNVRGSRIRPLSDPISMAGDLFEARLSLHRANAISAIVIRDVNSEDVTDLTKTASIPSLGAISTCPIVSWGEHGAAILFALCPPSVVDSTLELLNKKHDVGRIEIALADLERKRPLKLLNSRESARRF